MPLHDFDSFYFQPHKQFPGQRVTFFFRRESSDGGERVEKFPQLHDPVGPHEEAGPQRVDDLLAKDPLHRRVVLDVLVRLRSVQEAVEHAERERKKFLE